jgi:hypothetical protein
VTQLCEYFARHMYELRSPPLHIVTFSKLYYIRSKCFLTIAVYSFPSERGTTFHNCTTLLISRFQVLTAPSVKITVFLDVTRCGLVEVYSRMDGSCFRHIQDRKILFHSEDGGRPFFRNAGKNPTDYTTSHPRRQYSSTFLILLNLISLSYTNTMNL